MGLNPDTDKIEELSLIKDIRKDLKQRKGEDIARQIEIAQTRGQLVRPDGSLVPKHWAIFSIGELVKLKDSTFKVIYFNESFLILEPAELAIKDKTIL